VVWILSLSLDSAVAFPRRACTRGGGKVQGYVKRSKINYASRIYSSNVISTGLIHFDDKFIYLKS
jgi:hypothetical protein